MNQKPEKASEREHSKEVPADATSPALRDDMQNTTKDRPAKNDADDPSK